MRVGFPICLREERWRGMYKGWTPTLIGYSLQGCFKFGLYEVFKILYSEVLGEVGWFVCLPEGPLYTEVMNVRDAVLMCVYS